MNGVYWTWQAVPTPGQWRLVIKLFANFGKRHLVLEPWRKQQGPRIRVVFSISYSSNSPSKRERLSRAAHLEAEGCLGIIGMQTWQWPDPWKLLSIPLRCSKSESLLQGTHDTQNTTWGPTVGPSWKQVSIQEAERALVEPLLSRTTSE